MPPNGRTRKTMTDPLPTFALDTRELWAAAARTGMDPVTAKGISQLTGIQEATLSRILAGKRGPSAAVLAALHLAFPDDYDLIARPVEDGDIRRYSYRYARPPLPDART